MLSFKFKRRELVITVDGLMKKVPRRLVSSVASDHKLIVNDKILP